MQIYGFRTNVSPIEVVCMYLILDVGLTYYYTLLWLLLLLCCCFPYWFHCASIQAQFANNMNSNCNNYLYFYSNRHTVSILRRHFLLSTYVLFMTVCDGSCACKNTKPKIIYSPIITRYQQNWMPNSIEITSYTHIWMKCNWSILAEWIWWSQYVD